jgi:hypothetical protein
MLSDDSLDIIRQICNALHESDWETFLITVHYPTEVYVGYKGFNTLSILCTCHAQTQGIW